MTFINFLRNISALLLFTLAGFIAYASIRAGMHPPPPKGYTVNCDASCLVWTAPCKDQCQPDYKSQSCVPLNCTYYTLSMIHNRTETLWEFGNRPCPLITTCHYHVPYKGFVNPGPYVEHTYTTGFPPIRFMIAGGLFMACFLGGAACLVPADNKYYVYRLE